MVVSTSRRIQRLVDFVAGEASDMSPDFRLEAVQLLLLHFQPEVKELARRADTAIKANLSPRDGNGA